MTAFIPISFQGKPPNKISNCTCLVTFQFNDQNGNVLTKSERIPDCYQSCLYVQSLTERRTEALMTIAHGKKGQNFLLS